MKILRELSNIAGRAGRFRYAQVEIDDKTLFMKQALQDEEAEHLTRELLWCEYADRIAEKYPELGVRAPKFARLLEDGSFVCEWIDGELLALPTKPHRWVNNLDRFIEMLVAFDTTSSEYQPSTQYDITRRHPREQLNWWLRDIKQTDIISRAVKSIHDTADSWTYTMQHGDLTAWQIMRMADDEWVIFDGERSGDDLPRFNDVAYSYGRLALRCRRPEAAEQLLAGFIRVSNIHDTRQLRGVILLRLLGMYGDSIRDGLDEERQMALEMINTHLNELAP